MLKAAALAVVVLALAWSWHGVLALGFVHEDAHWLSSLTGNLAPTWDLSAWTLQLNTRLGGATPWGFHLVNLALHVGNTILVWALARALGLSPTAALVAAYVFMFDPLTVGGVAYVSGRPDLLATTFSLGALIAALRTRLDGRPDATVGVTITLTVLAVLAKPAAIAVVPMVAWTVLAGTVRWNPARAWRVVLGFEALTVVAVAVTPLHTVLKFAWPLHGRFMGQQAAAVFALASEAVTLHGFSVDHDYALVSVLVGTLSLLALAGLTAVAVMWRTHTAAWLLLLAIGLVAPRLFLGGAAVPQLPEYLNEKQFYAVMPALAVFAGLCIDSLCGATWRASFTPVVPL